jgi:hypothetical protein
MALLKIIVRGGPNFPSWAGRRILVALAGLLCCGPAVSAPVAPSREYQVKAVFLFNFAQFVDWPPAAFAGAEAPLVIGVLGEDPFGNSLDEVTRDETVGRHKLTVRRYRRVEEIETCHVLFISRSEAARLAEIFTALRGRSILTVGDAEGFAQNGGMIRLLMENNKVRLRINVAAAKAASLTISSKLLRPAEIVGTGKTDR